MNSTAWLLRSARATRGRTRAGGAHAGPPFAFAALAAFFCSTSLLAAPDKPAGYVGSETCQPCHEEAYSAFQRNPHQKVETDKKRGWETMACESCHGPGGKHAESADPANIINPSKLPAAKADQGCLKCHLNQPTHVGRLTGSHARNQVACTACHSIHKGPSALRPTTAVAINKECASCHTSTWAEFQKPFRHRLPEGAMSCVDCHNPHGSFQPRMMQTSAANEPGCFKCHGNLRGPFTYEHMPVRAEGCRACHEPHGSANPRMLVRHEVRLVCLECHSNISATKVIGGVPPAFHDLRSARYRNCTICHVKIHGSFVDSALER
jgi:DmsE family decaheme c-type cytochrome